MIKKFEEFITEQITLNYIDVNEINESRKETKRIAEIAKRQVKKME